MRKKCINEVVDEFSSEDILSYLGSVPSEDRVRVQRPIWVEKCIWDAAGKIKGITRPQIIRNALLEAILDSQTEIPQIEEEIRKLDEEIEERRVLKNAKLHILEELRSRKIEAEKNAQLEKINKSQAVEELMRFLEMFFREMGMHHFYRLEELSGVPAKEIKKFVESKNYTPSREEIQNFFNL